MGTKRMHGRHILGLTNIEELEEWLSHVGDDIQASLITRKALRSLPFIIGITDNGINDEATLLALRATLLGAVHCTSHDLLVATLHAVHDKAKSFASNVAKENQNAAAALRNSGDAAYAHTPLFNKEEAFFAIIPESHPEETLRDTQCISQGIENAPFSTTLWATNSPSHSHNLAKDKFEHSKDRLAHEWSFWIDWYQGFLDGKPLDWELQRRVALIADPIWEEGPEAIAQEIERIKAEWLTEQLPMAETIELNPETAKFRAVPVPVENTPFVSALLDQVEDALEDCLDGHNGLRADMGDARKIKRVLTKYRNDPQNAELTLTRVATNLRRQIYEEQWLPDNTDNSALLSSVEDAVRGIRSNHPDVAQNRQAQAALAVHELPEEGRAILEQAAPILSAVSEGAMADDFAIDIPELINDATTPLPSGASPLPGVDVSTRMFSRVSKMAVLTATYENASAKGAKIFDSNLVKSIRLAGLAITTLSGLSAFLYGLVQIGLRLFGVL